MPFPRKKHADWSWMVHSSLPDSWATTESTKKEASALLSQLSGPWVPANYYYKSNGSPGRQKESKKITMQRFLSEDKQQGSQRLQKTGIDGFSAHHSSHIPLQKKGCKAAEGSSELWEGGEQSLPQGLGHTAAISHPSPGGFHTSHRP